MKIILVCLAIAAVQLAACSMKTEGGTVRSGEKQRVTVVCPGGTFKGHFINDGLRSRIVLDDGGIMVSNGCATIYGP